MRCTRPCRRRLFTPKGKGLTERALTKIVTPGTILTDDSLADSNNNYLALILEAEAEIALAGADISTGEMFYSLYGGDNREQNLFDELYRLNPHEILITGAPTFLKRLKNFAELKLENCSFTNFEAEDKSNFSAQHFGEENLPAAECAALAVENLLQYIHKTLRNDLKHISKLTRLDLSNHLILDATALKNLEVVRSLRDGSKKNTLFEVLDFTKTSPGNRLLKKWLESPLIDVNEPPSATADISPLTIFNVPPAVAEAELFVAFNVIVPSFSVEEFSVVSKSNSLAPRYFLPLTVTVPEVFICVAKSTTTVEFAAVSISSIALAEPLSLSVNLEPLTVNVASLTVGEVDLS